MSDDLFMEAALALARRSFETGGIPIGSVLVRSGTIIGSGHNQRIQKGDPILHGEMDCIRNAGRQRTYGDTCLYTTLSPCMMCSGTIIQFKIPRVVIGENRSFGCNEEFLRDHGVELKIIDCEECFDLMQQFIRLNSQAWSEDIGE
jgi:cytosine deaminase